MQNPKEFELQEQRARNNNLYKMNNIFPYLSTFTSSLPNKVPFFNEYDMQTYGKLFDF
jgi:hypothetical protein